MIPTKYDIVALTADVSATHPETQQPVRLRKAQVGTVLTTFNDEAFLVDFADNAGQTYAIETVPLQKLMLLLHEPITTAA